jgi:glycosyltransferase involved in cell wall biosynthesis
VTLIDSDPLRQPLPAFAGHPVLIAGPLPPPTGGVATAVRELAEACRLHGVDVSVFDTSPHGTPGRTAVRAARRAPQVVGLLWRFRHTLKATRPAVVSIEEGTGFGLLRGAALARAAGRTPVVLSMHGASITESLDRLGPLRGFVVKTMRRVAVIRVLHEGERQAIEDLLGGHSRSEVIAVPNFVEPGAPPKRPRTSELLRLVSVGTPGRRKGSFVLLEALAALKSEGVQFACSFIGAEEHVGELKELLALRRQLHLEDCSHFAGEMAGDDTRTALCSADVFVLPSLAEGLPFAILEAMSVGLPIVSTAVGGIPNAVQQPGLPLLPPGDSEALAAAIRQLAEDPVGRVEIGRGNRRRIEERYSAEAVIPHMADVWMRAARGR